MPERLRDPTKVPHILFVYRQCGGKKRRAKQFIVGWFASPQDAMKHMWKDPLSFLFVVEFIAVAAARTLPGLDPGWSRPRQIAHQRQGSAVEDLSHVLERNSSSRPETSSLSTAFGTVRRKPDDRGFEVFSTSTCRKTVIHGYAACASEAKSQRQTSSRAAVICLRVTEWLL